MLDHQNLISVFDLKGKSPDAYGIGAEIELFPVHRNTFKMKSYFDPGGAKDLLTALHEQYQFNPQYENENILSAKANGDYVTLEPGGIIEYATDPVVTVAELEDSLKNFYHKLHTVATPLQTDFLAIGHLPYDRIEDIPLIPKKRYDFMYEYMPQVGHHGQEMMKLCAALQVSIDYSSEADAMRKLVLAAKATPLFIALSANSSMMNGQYAHMASRRARVWHYTENARCGVQPFIFNKNPSFEDYIAWAMDAPMYFVERDGQLNDINNMPFKEFTKTHDATLEDWELHLSTLFPWVRLRHYVEIRSFDIDNFDLQLAIIALIKGLFYTPEALDQFEALLQSFNKDNFDEVLKATEKSGLDAIHEDIVIRAYCFELLEIASASLARLGHGEQKYLWALEQKCHEWSLDSIKNQIKQASDLYLQSKII